jgi:SAM-dependent methyltransferase
MHPTAFPQPDDASAPAAAPRCKCCGGPTRPFARHDAARSCADRAAPAFPPCGRMVAYHRCRRCGFVFTTDFDALSDAALGAAIYDADYIRADPDFAEARPRLFADYLRGLLARRRGPPSVLDYGGGAGRLAGLLREQGIACDNFDPYFAAGAAPPGKPEGGYDLVTAFEVFEHSRDPLATARDALRWLAPTGVLLFSTHLQPRRLDPDWWYIAPRNGHVSLHSAASLGVLARRLGLRLLSVGEVLHVFWPPPAAAAVRAMFGPEGQSALYYASRRGVLPWVRTAAALARLGVKAAADPRHPARALLRR